MRLFLAILAIQLLVISLEIAAQKNNTPQKQHFRIMCYNVENLFDTHNDPNTQDDEFTPTSFRRWNTSKFKQKANHIGQVIAAVGSWQQVEIVALCEIENDTVLRHLTKYSALKQAGYSYIATQSLDPRGIDVALLYQKETLRLIADTSYRIQMNPNTRDILHATGIIPTGDTLHILITHLPSKRGGSRATQNKRKKVMKKIDEIHTSILKKQTNPHIIIMGDFNDQADQIAAISTKHILYKRPFGKIDNQKLYALIPPVEKNHTGTYKYQGKWSNIDQIIVSGSLLNQQNTPHINQQKAHIFKPNFLLTDDPDYNDKRPARTYLGRNYLGAYSDHLPIFCDLILR